MRQPDAKASQHGDEVLRAFQTQQEYGLFGKFWTYQKCIVQVAIDLGREKGYNFPRNNKKIPCGVSNCHGTIRRHLRRGNRKLRPDLDGAGRRTWRTPKGTVRLGSAGALGEMRSRVVSDRSMKTNIRQIQRLFLSAVCLGRASLSKVY